MKKYKPSPWLRVGIWARRGLFAFVLVACLAEFSYRFGVARVEILHGVELFRRFCEGVLSPLVSFVVMASILTAIGVAVWQTGREWKTRSRP